MMKLSILSACLAGVMSLPLGAAENKPAMPAGHPEIAKPSTRPAMPAGHPEIGGAKSGGMPAGHPEVGGKPGAMPPGHPPMGGAAPGTMPPGHPPMDAPTTPFTATTIKLKALVGTKDGKALGEAPVFADFYGEKGDIIKSIQTKLDAKGEATIEGPGIMCQPVVRVNYQGMGYRAIGRVMDTRNRVQDLEVKVYETTDKKPEWLVNMHHVLVKPGQGGLHVIEMLAVSNPSDKTWTGSAEGGQEKHTLSLPLTPGAINVSAPHAPEGAVHFHGGTVLSTLPLTPGRGELQVEYGVPAKDGKADITITAPAAVGQLFVFVADDGSNVTADGLESMGTRETGEGKKKAFKAAGLKAGQKVKLSFTGVKPTTAPAAGKTASSASKMPQIVAGVGGGIVLIGGLTYILLKSPKKNA